MTVTIDVSTVGLTLTMCSIMSSRVTAWLR